MDTENTEDSKEDEKDITNNTSEDSSSNTIESSSPFKWLQCVDDTDLAFAIVNPFAFKPDYEIVLSSEIIETLKIEKEEDVALYAIIVVPEDITKMTMNLRAPVVINVKNKKGAQTILDTEKYSVRYYIMEEKAGQEVKSNACTVKKEKSVHSNR